MFSLQTAKTFLDDFRIGFKLGAADKKSPMKTLAYGMYNKDRTMFYARIDGKIYWTTPDNLPWFLIPSIYHKDLYTIKKEDIIPPD